jgi:hypothetical protein
MVEIVKKEDVKGKSGSIMSLGEKKLVASADSQAKTGVNISGNAQRTTVGATVNGVEMGVDNATNLDVAKPDDDIKQMLAQLQGGVTGAGAEIGPDGKPVGGVVGPDGMPIGTGGTGMAPMTAGIIKGMLFTVYMIPSYIYRVEYKPDQFTIDIKGQQLADILERYGVSDVKYLDVLFFGAGVLGDMAGIMGKCKELKEEKDFKKKLDEERRIEELQWKDNEESKMLKDGLAANRASDLRSEKKEKRDERDRKEESNIGSDMVNAEGGI